jgi:uncharacterized protein YeaO (DUF488 family)
MVIRLKRAYETAGSKDGVRFLVDKLWPRGIRKEDLHLKAWLKEVAPSQGLRKWFAHDPAKWPEFQRRYWAELKKRPESWRPLLEAARQGPLILLYSARDTAHNNAVALKAFLDKHA